MEELCVAFLQQTLSGRDSNGCVRFAPRSSSFARLNRYPKQSSQLRSWISGAHERLAYQEGVDLMSAHECHIRWREYAALGDDDSPRGNPFQQLQGRIQPGFKRAQVAVIDANQGRSQLQCKIQLGAIVHLDQHGHP